MTTLSSKDIKPATMDIKHFADAQLDFAVGIDAGVNTGFAVWSKKAQGFALITTVKFHKALEMVKEYTTLGYKIKVIVEDARQVRFKTDANKAKGAGSVCRDAKVWEDFLTELGIPFEMVRPNKQITNWTAEEFSKRTGHKGRTSTHARDAALLVYQY